MNTLTNNYCDYADCKLADLITSDYNLLTVLNRFGIRLGFGEATVSDVCKRYGIAIEPFLAISSVYCGNNMPDVANLDIDALPHILLYLQRSHNYYKRDYFPQLTLAMEQLTATCDAVHKQILGKFYNDYCTEVNRHFDYEEQSVFPYVEQMIQKQLPRRDYHIRQFARSHSDIDEALNDLKSIIIKYLPESSPDDLRAHVLREVFQLEEDLRKHTLIENQLLIPLTMRLEKVPKKSKNLRK